MNKSKKLRAIACLLCLSVMAGCSIEEQPSIGEWVPVEVNIGSIEQIEVSPMGTKAWDTELPSIIKTEFNIGDEIRLTYTLDGTPVTVPFVLNNEGKWEKKNSTPFLLPATADNSAPVEIKAEYGTPMEYKPDLSYTDYLIANATTTYDSDTKRYICNFGQFKRPDDYICLYIKILIINPPMGYDSQPIYFTRAKFYKSYPAATIDFPINNGFAEIFYRGDAFTATGVHFEVSDNANFREIDVIQFNDYNESSFLEFSPGIINPVQLIVPFKPTEP